MTRLVLNRTNPSRPQAAAPAGRLLRTGGWFSRLPVRAIRRAQILDFFTDRPPGRVLDVPAGSLWLARALADRRFEVHALDLLDQESSAAAVGIRYVRGNLDQGLPQFSDQTFDYIISTEGLEHLEHPALLLREFARVLKPLGTLLVTTPNVVSLRSRLKFLLFGYFDGFRRRALFRCLGRPRNLETPHISPIHIQFLYYWLVGAGFTHIHAHSLPVHRLERLALQPLAALVTVLGWSTRRHPDDRYQAEFRTLLLSRPLLFSPTVILTAQRVVGAGGGVESE